MPYTIRKLPNQNLYKVYNTETKTIHSYATTLENANKQVKLLHMVDAGVPLKKQGEGIDNPELYEKAKQIADETYKKPSAYKSGFIVKKYKELGGTYSGNKDNKGIGRWFKEEWKDIGGKEYPVYRPTKRITKDTPLTPDEIKPDNLKKQIALKQKIKGDDNLPPFEGGSVNCQNIPSFSRIGSKKKLLNKILEYFPTDNWNTFVEPFAGSAQVYKGINKEPNKKYILNDKNKDIYNIWKNMKSVDSKKMDNFDWKGSKKQFDFLKDKFQPKTKEEQLYKDLYLSRYSYANMRTNYADKKKKYGGINFKYLNCSNEIQDIMKNTTILNQDYKSVIKKYDSPTTLFYIDPPYFNKEHLYEKQSVIPKELKDILSKIKGKFILSYNDVPEVNTEFSDFNIYKVPVRYQWRTVKDGKQNEKIVNELIITNYKSFKKQGGSIETDNFTDKGIVSLPEFRSVKIDLPTYMYKRMPDIKGKPPPYRYRLVIPITKARNISSRKKQTSIDISQKPISIPEVNIEENYEKPKIEEFSPSDRVKIQEYYLNVMENEDKEPNEIEKDPYEIKQRGKPLPCSGSKKSKKEKPVEKPVLERKKTKEIPKEETKEKPFELDKNQLAELYIDDEDAFNLYEDNREEFRKKYGKKYGLGIKNKISVNNNKMSNPWIMYVKEYASKNGMSYRDALKDPKCKAGYKKPMKKGAGVIDEIGKDELIALMNDDSGLGANAGKKYISL
jgi:DNA adenine methylase